MSVFDSDSSSEDTISMPDEMSGEFLDEGSNDSSKDISIKKAFDLLIKEHLEKGKEKEIDVIAKLIETEKLNTMRIDLFDYEIGFVVSFCKFEDNARITHGLFSYGVSVLDYIKDGEIPYELFDKLYNYDFQLFYDGYIACELKIHIDGKDIPPGFLDNEDNHQASMSDEEHAPCISDEQRSVPSYSDEQDVEPLNSNGQDDQVVEPLYFDLKEGIRSHYVLLKHSIQTIDGECCMNVKREERLGKKMSSVEYDQERSRLIHHYSPDLCLDPDPVVGEILFSNGVKQHSLVTPHFKRVIQNEKEKIELVLNPENKPKSKSTKPEDPPNWKFTLNEPAEKEVKFSKLGSDMEGKLEISSYLKVRKMCFPDKDFFTGSHVEIENFVYEYEGITRTGEKANILDKLIISVIDDKEFYYGAYQLDERMKNNAPSDWWEIGDRESLDMYVVAVTKEETKMTCGKIVKVTHNRLFDERVEISEDEGGEEILESEIKIIRQKLEVPISTVILCKRLTDPQHKKCRKNKN